MSLKGLKMVAKITSPKIMLKWLDEEITMPATTKR